MAVVTFSGGINNALRVKNWAVKIWHVHQRDQFFYHWTAQDGTNVVQEKLDFTREGGYQMTEGLIMPLVSDGVTGDGIMEDWAFV